MRTAHLTSVAKASSISNSVLGFAACGLLALPACSKAGAQPTVKLSLDKPTASSSVTQGLSVQHVQPANVDTSGETRTLQTLTDAFLKFHDDTGGWPLGEGVWTQGTNPELQPTEVTQYDTALFKKPDGLEQCGGNVAKPCWGGPYLIGGSSLADSAYNDQWGHVHLIAFYRPFDQMGGGALTAPDGAVLIWSRGPDGVDQTGCIEGRCSRDDKKVAVGQLSVASADDVLTVVGTTK